MSTPLPPLVEPAAELTREEVARYSRHLIIPDLGLDGQKRLKNARVLVIGAAGWARRRCCTSPRRASAPSGSSSSTSSTSPTCSVRSSTGNPISAGQGRRRARLDRDQPAGGGAAARGPAGADNAVSLFEQYDLILDGTDNFATRYLVNDAAVLAGKPYVWGSIYRFEGQVSVFWEDAPTAWA